MSEVKLVRYDAARKALANATRVDEVKNIRDKAMAMQVYAKQAQDRELIDHATDIRFRAERRAGELLAGMEKNKGAILGKTGRKGKPVLDPKPKLSDLGVTKMQSSRWQKLAAMNNRDFERAVTSAKDGVNKSTQRVQSAATKGKSRAKRERELARSVTAMPGNKYGVLYADPPWRFEPYSRKTGMDRAADNHYPTMSLDEIMQLDIPAAKDCILFLWATVPMLPQALAVMAAWNFEYKSHLVWDKMKIGTGYWSRNRHELLLIGTRGDVPAPDPKRRSPSVIAAARVERHSKKPEVFRAMIEKMFPTVPKIELFARKAADGWDVWGNEVKQAAE